MAGITLQILFLIFSTEVFGVPTSQQCPPTQMLRLATGSRLELECKSSCGPATSTFEWVKSGSRAREEASTLEADDYGLVIESATYEDGGIYKCRCLPDGPQCEHSVYIIPTMEFVASDKYIYSGDSVEFSCTVSMSQPKFPTIRLASGGSLDHSSHETRENSRNSHTVETELWLYEQKKLKEDYVCEVESYCGDKLMEKLEKNLSIYSYIPPEVVFTTEFKLESTEDFGKPGKVSCSVLSSPDTGCMVTWLFKGKPVPLDHGKYSIESSIKNSDVTEYVLLVHDVQAEDLGKYMCRLTSDFNLESENEVWIKFKNEDTIESVGANTGTSTGKMSVIFYGFCIMGVLLMCSLGVWLKSKINSNGDRKRV